ncbi:AAA family ATPase [Enterococcus olivae]
MKEAYLDRIPKLIDEVQKVILGKREVIQMTVAALLAGGHVLFEDIPGVGKTLMIKTLSQTIQSSFSRVQFTPDLLPSDILGVSIFDKQTNQFEFRKGPIFTTVLLADEINRTTPRTQAALLEAMSEGRVTIDNTTYQLSPHFFVLATQNPVEYEGTYPLPEAQLDRFLFRLKIGYPAFEDELSLMMGRKGTEEQVQKIISEKEVDELKEMVNDVFVHEHVAKYALQLVQASRNHNGVALGVSPRGGVAFIQGAKAYALTEGRQYITPEDLQKILPPVFGHRMQLKNRGDEEELSSILQQIVERVPVPVRR